MLPPSMNNMILDSDPSSPSSFEFSDANSLRPRSPHGSETDPNLPYDLLPHDEIGDFCRFMGRRLKALDPRTRLQVQIQILQIIHDVEYAKL